MLKTNKTLVLLAMVLTCMSCSKKTQETKAPVRVKTETTSTAGTYGGEKYVGIVEEREATSVSFTSMGVVRRMLVSEGQMVSRGQLLAELDPTSMDNSVEAAKASTSQAHDMVAQARNTYDQAKDAYDRMKLLHDNGSLPEIKWIEAETRLKQAETALHTAESGVRSATAAERIVRKNLSDTRLYAPVPGIIGRKQVGAGETALPSQSVVTILDISSVKVKVSVPEQEMTRIAIGGAAKAVVPSLDNRELKLRISDKSLIANPLGHTYRVHASVVEGDVKDLLPDMVTKVTVASEVKNDYSEERRVVMPSNCIHTMPQGQIVWVIENGAAKQRTVTVGDFVKRGVLITDGLTQGDTVITEGHQKMYTGAKVKVIE